MVIKIAITPSLKSSRRPLVMATLWQDVDSAAGAPGGRTAAVRLGAPSARPQLAFAFAAAWSS